MARLATWRLNRCFSFRVAASVPIPDSLWEFTLVHYGWVLAPGVVLLVKTMGRNSKGSRTAAWIVGVLLAPLVLLMADARTDERWGRKRRSSRVGRATRGDC